MYERGYPTGQVDRVTPSDTLYVRGEKVAWDYLRINGAGTLVITKPDGTDHSSIDVVAGELVLMRGIRVKSTGTSATGIDAYFPDEGII